MTSSQLIVKLQAALSQLLHEVLEAGFETASDYNWPKSIADAREALKASDDEAADDRSHPAQ